MLRVKKLSAGDFRQSEMVGGVMVRAGKRAIFVLAVSLAGGLGQTAEAQEFNGPASEQEAARAIGHYARARSLLIAALREFDIGRRVAEPSTLLDPAEWRDSIANRASELERVLDPQPRSTSKGVTFSPDRRLLAEQTRTR